MADQQQVRLSLTLAAIHAGHELADIIPFVESCERFIQRKHVVSASPDADTVTAVAVSEFPMGTPSAGQGSDPDPAALTPHLRLALEALSQPISLAEAATRLGAKMGSVKAYHYELRKRGFNLPPLPSAVPAKRPAANLSTDHAGKRRLPAAHQAVHDQPMEQEIIAKPPAVAENNSHVGEEAESADQDLAPPTEAPAGTDNAALGDSSPARHPPKQFLAGFSNQDGQIVALRRHGWNAAQIAGRFSMTIPELNAILRRLERDGFLPKDIEA